MPSLKIDEVDIGAVCVWLEGDSLAFLFGPTPVSRGTECRLISPANVVGSIDGDSRILGNINAGDTIQVQLAETVESP